MRSETEPLPPNYLDEEDHLRLEDEELVEGTGDDGVMIASLIDCAAEKNMDMELVAALAAEATPLTKGANDSFDHIDRSANDSVNISLSADFDNFMNDSSESFALDAQEKSENRGERSASSADTVKSVEKDVHVKEERGIAESTISAAMAGENTEENCQDTCRLRRDVTPNTNSALSATRSVCMRFDPSKTCRPPCTCRNNILYAPPKSIHTLPSYVMAIPLPYADFFFVQPRAAALRQRNYSRKEVIVWLQHNHSQKACALDNDSMSALKSQATNPLKPHGEGEGGPQLRGDYVVLRLTLQRRQYPTGYTINIMHIFRIPSFIYRHLHSHLSI